MSSSDLFDEALAFIKDPNNSDKFQPDNMQRLHFYAYFKQATDGPCTGPAPSRLKVVEKAKYDAWKSLGNMTKEEARKKYAEYLTKCCPTWNTKPKL